MGQEGSDLNEEMARRSLAPLAIATTLLFGCANDSARRPSPDAAPTTTVVRTTIPIPTITLPDLTASNGLAASIRQFREDEIAGVVQAELVREPGGAGLVAVTSVQIEWPGFASVAPTERSVQVAPGQRVDLPTPLGSVVCATEVTPSFSTGSVIVTTDPGDGTTLTVRAPLLADAQPALDNVWTKGCTRQRLLDRVGLAYDTPWLRSDPGGVPSATADLLITRRDTTEPISVTGVDGSVLLFVNPAAPLPNPGSTVAADATAATTPIVVTGAGRCDGHALSDSKKTYVFQVLVQVGDDAPVGIDLPVPDADRPLLNQVIVDTCGTEHAR